MANRWVCLTDNEIELIKACISLHDSAGNIIKKLEKAKGRIKISSAKGKGRELQKWVCEQVAKICYTEYDQQDDQCEIHSREMGQAGTDIIVRGHSVKLFPFAVECKSSESFNIKETVEQVKANQGMLRNWIIFHRRKSIPETLAVLDAKVLFELVKGYNSWEEEMGRL